MVMVHGKRRKNIIIVCAVSILLLVGSIGGWLLFGRTDAPPLPKQIIAQADFPLYFPSTLPTGYTLKVNSVGGDTSAVYYTLVDATGKKAITITMQATPASFDASKIIGSNPIPTTIIPIGTLYNLSTGGTSKYMLNTSKTLLFITSSTAIDGKIINAITANLAEIKTR
jgi:hypothetical protein